MNGRARAVVFIISSRVFGDFRPAVKRRRALPYNELHVSSAYVSLQQCARTHAAKATTRFARTRIVKGVRRQAGVACHRSVYTRTLTYILFIGRTHPSSEYLRAYERTGNIGGRAHTQHTRTHTDS